MPYEPSFPHHDITFRDDAIAVANRSTSSCNCRFDQPTHEMDTWAVRDRRHQRRFRPP